MDAKEKKQIQAQISALQSLIQNAEKDNPNIKGWKQEIANYKARLTF